MSDLRFLLLSLVVVVVVVLAVLAVVLVPAVLVAMVLGHGLGLGEETGAGRAEPEEGEEVLHISGFIHKTNHW